MSKNPRSRDRQVRNESSKAIMSTECQQRTEWRVVARTVQMMTTRAFDETVTLVGTHCPAGM